MTCSQAKELMAAAWLDDNDAGRDPELRRHLETCAECREDLATLGPLWARLADLPAPEPSPALNIRWQSTLESLTSVMPEVKPAPRVSRTGFSWLSLWPSRPVWQFSVALGCLLVGLLIGSLRPQRGGDEIAKLHEEIANTRAMVALSLLQQQSATERLRGVNYSGQMRTVEPEVVSALIQAVGHDPNVNVRLAAIDALSKSAGNTQVVQSLARSLPQQDSPMVQAALIDYLVDARDRQAVGTLRQLALQPDLNPAVRERTQFALRQLSQ
jgi:hypothetical protein